MFCIGIGDGDGLGFLDECLMEMMKRHVSLLRSEDLESGSIVLSFQQQQQQQ